MNNDSQLEIDNGKGCKIDKESQAYVHKGRMSSLTLLNSCLKLSLCSLFIFTIPNFSQFFELFHKHFKSNGGYDKRN